MKRRTTKQLFKYVKPENDLWNLINSCLYTACTHDNAKASINNNVLIITLRNGVFITVENFIGNQSVQELNDTSMCYADLGKVCPFGMGHNCAECSESEEK